MDIRTLARNIESRDYDDSEEDCHRTSREAKHPITGEWVMLATCALDVNREYMTNLQNWLDQEQLVLGADGKWSYRKPADIEF